MSDRQEWARRVLLALASSSQEGAEAVQEMRSRGVALGVRQQSTGARWSLGHRIDLNPGLTEGAPDAPYVLSLVLHELEHLRQGPLVALSVYGELAAWQVQFRFLQRQTGALPATVRRESLERLLGLKLTWERETLRAARTLMQEYAGAQYRIDLLPLYPIHREIAYWLTGRQPVQLA